MPYCMSGDVQHIRIAERDDIRAWMTACEEQAHDSFRAFEVSEVYDDPDLEYLRQWLLSKGATEADEFVFLSVCW